MIEEVTFADIPNCLKLSNGSFELIVPVMFGPRILFYGRTGGKNIFAELGDSKQPNELGDWYPRGGHRLWATPEIKPDTYYPDNEPVTVGRMNDFALRVTGPIEKKTNLMKSIEIALDPKSSTVTLHHWVTNLRTEQKSIAPWALTIMRPSGVAFIPQEPHQSHDDVLLPARPLVLWYFTNMTDPRWRFGKKLISLRVDPNERTPQKIGVLNRQGWAAYYESNELFVKQFSGAAHDYPDFGSNNEIYTDGPFIEIESLGALREVSPGESVRHTERWSLFNNVTLPEEEGECLAELLRYVPKQPVTA